MSGGDERPDEMLDRLILQIKAVSLLQGSDAELRERLERKLLDSKDESIRKFVRVVREGQKPETGGLLLISLGELTLASLFVLAGAVTLLPSLLGIGTAQGLVQYLGGQAASTVAGSPLSPYLSLMEFALGAFFLLAASYTLRHAALDLKKAGLAVRSGDS